MVRGNKALSSHRSEEAIQRYTEVLYKLSPGHVCAFLNRSMAYIDEGYYDLVVMDAYRACMAASELCKNTRVADTRLSKTTKYIKAERLHVEANDKWTRPRYRNIGNGWARSPLASIVINATPEATVPNGVNVPPFGTSKGSLIKALEIRATYRLCGTLFMMGQGARKDALGLLDDAKSRMKMTAWESEWFDKLGTEIMLQFLAEVDPWDQNDLRLLGHDTKEKRDERMMKVKKDAEAATTDFGYGDYPWDPYEPNLKNSDWQKKVHAWAEICSENCSALVVEPEETDDTLVEGAKPYVELRAKRDINSGDLVLSEQTFSNVTTSIPEHIAAKRRAGVFDHYYCNSCASLLAVPQQCPNKFQSTNVTSQDDLSTEANMTRQSQPSLGDHRQDFMFCRVDHIVPTCSTACRELGVDFDNGICRTRIEQKLRQSHLNDPNPRPMAVCKTQCLRDLIFLRQITMAINLDKSPLDINDLMFATSGPNMRDIENREVERWSFVSHVIRPLRYLYQLFENTNTDQFLKLSQLDGWVLYTLLFKINRVMRISQGPRYAKSFRHDGMLDTAFGPWDERWEGLTNLPNGQKDSSIWTASIDSLFNMIRIADPAKGEIPNVAVVQREGVNVYAVKTDGELTIRAGEPLLRAADGVETPVVDERLYAEDPQDPMEESQDGEEVHSGDTSEFFEESSTGEVDMNDADELGEEAGEAMVVHGAISPLTEER